MASFQLRITMDNAAFYLDGDESAYDPQELARMLHSLANHVESVYSTDKGVCRDLNGNKCGRWSITCAPSEDECDL